MSIVARGLAAHCVALVLLAGAAWGGSPPAAPKGVVPVAARLAPAIRLADIDGVSFDLARQKGHWVLVHFWASWCAPCRREIPALQRLAEKLKARQSTLTLAMVNTAEDEDTVFTFLGVLAPDLRPLMDRHGDVTEAWQPRGLPSTYLVDPQGMIRFQALGGRPWDEDDYFQFLIKLGASP